MAKPPSVRTIGLPVDSRITLGRAHQPGFFEGILGIEVAQRYLCCVSRSHLEIALVAGDQPGRFEVTNCSSNPVNLTGQGRLGKGEVGIIKKGESIDFLGGGMPGTTGLSVFLKLRLEEQSGSDIHVEAQSVRSPNSKYQIPRTSSFSKVKRLSESESSPSIGARLPASDRLVSYQSRETSSPALLPVPQEAAEDSPRSANLPNFWLTLCGSAVKEGYPLDARRLEGGEDGLSVGRAHQKELHLEAFDVELRQYLSRDHFRIDFGIDGLYKLVAISNNPIWRNRSGKRTEAVVGDPPLSLQNGDAIQLFTGAEDCTATGPGNLGSLLWIFQDATSNRRPTERDVSILESKANGHPQDIQDSADSGPRTLARGLDLDIHSPESVTRTPVSPQNGQHAGSRSPLTSDRPSRKDQTAGGVLRAPVNGMPPPLSGQPGPLRAPVRDFSLDDNHDDDDGEQRGNVREMSDLDFRDVDDAFAASGFRFS